MTEPTPRRGVSFWLALLIGWGLILIGTRDYVATHGTTDAIRVATWVVGGNIVHDAFVVPIALLVGSVLTRFTPEPSRTPIRAGLIGSACVLLVAIPVLGGYGRKPANPSVLPLDYDTAVLWSLGLVWALAALWLAIRVAPRAQGIFAEIVPSTLRAC